MHACQTRYLSSDLTFQWNPSTGLALAVATMGLQGFIFALHTFVWFLLLWYNSLTKATWGIRDLFISQLSGYTLSRREIRQELKQGCNLEARTWSRSHGGLLLPDLVLLTFSAYFLITSSTTCPEGALASVIWAHPHWLLTKKMPHRGVHRPIWEEHFSPFPKIYCVCQADKTLASTIPTLYTGLWELKWYVLYIIFNLLKLTHCFDRCLKCQKYLNRFLASKYVRFSHIKRKSKVKLTKSNSNNFQEVNFLKYLYFCWKIQFKWLKLPWMTFKK